MKVLIVDDNISKAGKLIALLVEAGINREDVHVVVSAMAARDRLRNERFTLMVLDLLLPLREEDAPAISTAIGLLEEIAERDAYHKPLHIVGFTAYPEAESEALQKFKRRLWTIVNYDETTNDWEEIFRNVASYLRGAPNKAEGRTYQTDLCVITALQIELDAVYALNWEWQEPEPLDDSTFIRRGSFISEGVSCSVVAACSPRMGSVAAGLLATKLINHFTPRFIAMPGICAGVRGKVEIGDLVLFDPAWEWPSGRLSDGESGSYLEPSPHQIPLSEFVVARAEQLKRQDSIWADAIRSWPGVEAPPSTPRLLIGPGASGSAVVAHAATIDAIKQQHRRLLAVEMEVYGVYAAARASSWPRPTAIGLKAVCDFADDTKADTHQKFCCFVSAHGMRLFFERYMADVSGLAGT